MRAVWGVIGRSLSLVAVVSALFAWDSAASAAERIIVDPRQIEIINGSTIRIGGVAYRLAGIAAPSRNQTCDHRGRAQPCGEIAANALGKLLHLEQRPIRCFVRPAADFPVAACLLGDAELSVLLLKGGYVSAVPNSAPHYLAAEDLAKQASLGIWGTTYRPPETETPVGAPLWRERLVERRELGVIDGDSIEFGGWVYQLTGIDAPELGQACDHGGRLYLCGLAAANELHKLIVLETRPIRCFIHVQAKPAEVACLVGEEEISTLLLRGGYVVARPGADLHYLAAEHLAKKASVGMWSGKFVPPWQWRAGKRLPGEHDFKQLSHLHGQLAWTWQGGRLKHQPRAGHAACLVKGVTTAAGEHLYFGPLDADYDAIAIHPERGDRLFCGDDAARKAGFRRNGERPAGD